MRTINYIWLTLLMVLLRIQAKLCHEDILILLANSLRPCFIQIDWGILGRDTLKFNCCLWCICAFMGESTEAWEQACTEKMVELGTVLHSSARADGNGWEYTKESGEAAIEFQVVSWSWWTSFGTCCRWLSTISWNFEWLSIILICLWEGGWSIWINLSHFYFYLLFSVGLLVQASAACLHYANV